MKTIETLGTVNVLCTDKTGTLTENKMEIQDMYEYSDTFIETSYLSCPKVAFDPMEIAIKEYCNSVGWELSEVYEYVDISKDINFTHFYSSEEYGKCVADYLKIKKYL